MDKNILAAALQHNPDLVKARDRYGKTLLHYAASFGSVPAVQLLIDAGAHKDTSDNEGKTPMQVRYRSPGSGWRDPLFKLLWVDRETKGCILI